MICFAMLLTTDPLICTLDFQTPTEETCDSGTGVIKQGKSYSVLGFGLRTCWE